MISIAFTSSVTFNYNFYQNYNKHNSVKMLHNIAFGIALVPMQTPYKI